MVVIINDEILPLKPVFCNIFYFFNLHCLLHCVIWNVNCLLCGRAGAWSLACVLLSELFSQNPNFSLIGHFRKVANTAAHIHVCNENWYLHRWLILTPTAKTNILLNTYFLHYLIKSFDIFNLANTLYLHVKFHYLSINFHWLCKISHSYILNGNTLQ